MRAWEILIEHEDRGPPSKPASQAATGIDELRRRASH